MDTRLQKCALHCASILAATIALGAACGSHAETTAAAPQLVFVFEETVGLSGGVPVGPTPLGTRNIIPITGGAFSGPGDGGGIKGTIIPGGWDWQLIHANGCVSIKADYMIKTDDGAVINVINSGSLCPPSKGQAMKPGYTTPVFEAPLGKYEWLNSSAYVGTLDLTTLDGKPAVHIRFYRAE